MAIKCHREVKEENFKLDWSELRGPLTEQFQWGGGGKRLSIMG